MSATARTGRTGPAASPSATARTASGRGALAGTWRHVRARRLELVALAVVAVALACGWAARWASAQEDLVQVDGSLVRLPVVALGSITVAVLLSVGLHGAEPELEASTPRLSAARRGAHALLAAALGGAATAAAMPHVQEFGAAAMVRDVVGLLGLVLLATAFAPPALSWVPAVGYGALAFLAAPRGASHGAAWWAWTLQGGGPDPSWLVAGALLVAGVAAYALRGPALAR